MADIDSGFAATPRRLSSRQSSLSPQEVPNNSGSASVFVTPDTRPDPTRAVATPYRKRRHDAAFDLSDRQPDSWSSSPDSYSRYDPRYEETVTPTAASAPAAEAIGRPLAATEESDETEAEAYADDADIGDDDSDTSTQYGEPEAQSEPEPEEEPVEATVSTVTEPGPSPPGPGCHISRAPVPHVWLVSNSLTGFHVHGKRVRLVYMRG